MIEARQGVFKAVPLDLSDPAKLTYVLDRLVERDSEWSDFHSDPTIRRTMASSMLAEALCANPRSSILEVWHFTDDGPSLVGLVGFSNVVRYLNADFHPIFFDGRFRNGFGKRELLLRCLDWAFHEHGLHRISVSIPDNSFALLDFSRKKLGFRFEGENRTIRQRQNVVLGHEGGHLRMKSHSWLPITPTAWQAEKGSRRYQALLQGGVWHDLLLLSVTRDEFASFVREELCRISSQDPPPSKPSPAT